jgi:hypothetical protein
VLVLAGREELMPLGLALGTAIGAVWLFAALRTHPVFGRPAAPAVAP